MDAKHTLGKPRSNGLCRERKSKNKAPHCLLLVLSVRQEDVLCTHKTGCLKREHSVAKVKLENVLEPLQRLGLGKCGEWETEQVRASASELVGISERGRTMRTNTWTED